MWNLDERTGILAIIAIAAVVAAIVLWRMLARRMDRAQNEDSKS
jgi:hypothetical protein